MLSLRGPLHIQMLTMGRQWKRGVWSAVEPSEEKMYSRQYLIENQMGEYRREKKKRRTNEN